MEKRIVFKLFGKLKNLASIFIFIFIWIRSLQIFNLEFAPKCILKSRLSAFLLNIMTISLAQLFFTYLYINVFKRSKKKRLIITFFEQK